MPGFRYVTKKKKKKKKTYWKNNLHPMNRKKRTIKNYIRKGQGWGGG